MSDRCVEMNEPHVPAIRLLPGSRNEREVGTTVVRRFLGIGDGEFGELTAFTESGIQVAQYSSEAEHVRLLGEAERLRGFAGVYMLVNGPLDPRLAARYEPCRWHRARNGRATDKDIQGLRAVFMDVDPVRPKGISATDDEQGAAWEVSQEIEAWLTRQVGPAPIGHGASGNGFFTLLALESCSPSDDTTKRISTFLTRLDKKFGKPGVKIDASVSNPARLMPAPGTMKRKGRDTGDRPHRLTSFVCRPTVVRLPITEIA